MAGTRNIYLGPLIYHPTRGGGESDFRPYFPGGEEGFFFLVKDEKLAGKIYLCQGYIFRNLKLVPMNGNNTTFSWWCIVRVHRSLVKISLEIRSYTVHLCTVLLLKYRLCSCR